MVETGLLWKVGVMVAGLASAFVGGAKIQQRRISNGNSRPELMSKETKDALKFKVGSDTCVAFRKNEETELKYISRDLKEVREAVKDIPKLKGSIDTLVKEVRGHNGTLK